MNSPKEELDLYREVYSMTGDIIYRYSISDDVMMMYKSNDVRSHFGTTINDYVKMLRNQNFNGDEKVLMESYIDAISSGSRGFFEQDMKLKIDTSTNGWYRVIGKTVYDDNNNPQYVVGKLVPIDANIGNFVNKDAGSSSLNDSLTGVLVSSEFKKQLSQKCDEHNGKLGGFLVLSVNDIHNVQGADMDKLKDNVYIHLVEKLRRHFFYDVLIGRIKQDEFAVAYYGNDFSSEFLSKVDDLKEDINNLDVMGVREHAISISGGVYCGVFEKDGMYEILEKTSMAMTFAKYYGTNTIQLYTKDLDDAFSTYYSEKRRIQNAEMKVEHKLIKNTLEVLNDSDDIGSAIHEMFSVVGKAFNIDRILMFEVDMNEKEIFSTYCWDKNGNVAPKHKKTRLDFRTLDWFNSQTDIRVVYDAAKIEDTNPLAAIATDGVKSFSVASFQVGPVTGCISFESHVNKRKFTESETRILELVRRIISTCFINIRLYKEMLSDVQYKDNHDALTGLYKYNVFLEEANKYISLHNNEQMGILSVSLEGFLRINGCYGFETGDTILKEYADVLKKMDDRFIMGCRRNADNLVFLTKLFDERGRMLTEATVEVLYRKFITECAMKYPAVELSINSGMCRVDIDGRDISAYIAEANRKKLKN